jgi:DNA-binding NtrC family response regulator
MSHANVLVVEDDPRARELMSALLIDMGYQVTSTENGDEALRYLYSEEACDVILSDVVMPGMSGVELARRCQEARPGLPVVLISGKPEGIASAMRSPSLALAKPFTRGRLSEMLDTALGVRLRDSSD